MKNILVTIGAHDSAINTLQYAIDFAENFNAKVYAVKVFGNTRVSGSLKNINAVLEEDVAYEINEVINEVDRKNVDLAVVSAKGKIRDSIETIAEELSIDLIVSAAKPISTDETLFLSKVSGSLVKDTNVPVLIVPTQYRYKNISKILMAVKSGKIRSNEKLNPLKELINKFTCKLDLIQVITPKMTDADKEVNLELKELSSKFTTTENATVFQGVLEYLHITEPDMLCVMRRKRGFFSRLWQDNAVKKADFESRLPLLILKGDK